MNINKRHNGHSINQEKIIQIKDKTIKNKLKKIKVILIQIKIYLIIIYLLDLDMPILGVLNVIMIIVILHKNMVEMKKEIKEKINKIYSHNQV